MNALNYLKMDLKIIGRSLNFFVIFFLAMIVMYLIITPTMGIRFLFLLLLVINATPFSVESKAATNRLYYSLPAKRSDMVAGRYLFFICSSLLCWLITLFAVIYCVQIRQIALVEILPEIFMAITMCAACSIQYPLFYKFGLQKGRLAGMLVYTIPAMLLFAFPTAVLKNTGVISSSMIAFLMVALIIIVFISFRISCKICAKKQI